MRGVAAVAAVLAALAACGGESPEERAMAQFGEYAAAEAERGDAELELNRAFRALSAAAGERDRVGVIAAVARGRDAIASIDRSLALEVEAARGLAGYGPTEEDGRALADALDRIGEGVRLIDRQLEIALRDPFLDLAANKSEISRLAGELTEVSVQAAFDRRRATRSIARTLGVEPPFDSMYDS